MQRSTISSSRLSCVHPGTMMVIVMATLLLTHPHLSRCSSRTSQSRSLLSIALASRHGLSSHRSHVCQSPLAQRPADRKGTPIRLLNETVSGPPNLLKRGRRRKRRLCKRPLSRRHHQRLQGSAGQAVAFRSAWESGREPPEPLASSRTYGFHTSLCPAAFVQRYDAPLMQPTLLPPVDGEK